MKLSKIAIIMTWFGSLPDYFPAWLISAEKNPSIDFFCICDHKIVSGSENIKYIQSTMGKEIAKFEKILKRKFDIPTAYKFCDCRAFFGILYKELLREYDFWGYCDIDLMFGDIRKFLTEDVLQKYDRIYSYGHLSLYRNCSEMNELYKKTGAIYTLEEVFSKPEKTDFEEFYGVNRICKINNVKWYIERDFADFRVLYPNTLNEGTSRFPVHKIFYWKDGKAICEYIDKNGEKRKVEKVYMHFQKRKLKLEYRCSSDSGTFYITPSKILIDSYRDMSISEMDMMNPPVTFVEEKCRAFIWLFSRLYRWLKMTNKMKKLKLREKKTYIKDKLGIK